MGVNVELMTDLRNGMGLEEALVKHNTNLKNALNITQRDWKAIEERHIYARSNGFSVVKNIGGINIYFGVYNSVSEAKKVRDELIKCDWDKSKLKRILRKLNIKVPIEHVGDRKYIYKTHNGKWSISKRLSIKGQMVRVYGGQYEKLSEAKIIRDELVQNDWNIELLTEIKRKHNIVDTQGR